MFPYPIPTLTDVEIAADIARTTKKVHDLGAERMKKEPWRITRAVYGEHITPAVWPCDKPATEVLCDCNRLVRAQESKGRSGHWSFDMNRLIALRQAEDALLSMIVGEAEEQKEAA